jgi:hypothetical protein
MDLGKENPAQPEDAGQDWKAKNEILVIAWLNQETTQPKRVSFAEMQKEARQRRSPV